MKNATILYDLIYVHSSFNGSSTVLDIETENYYLYKIHNNVQFNLFFQ